MPITGMAEIKNTLVWFFTVGIYSAFQVEEIKKDKKYLKRLVFDSFKFIAIIQFVTNIQPLSFVAEMLIAPILFVITLASVIAGKDKKFEVISKVINSLLVMFGLFILAKSLYFIISSFSTLDIEKIAYDFFTPPLLTLLYIPFLFFLMLYSTFDYAFTRVNVNIKKPYLRVFSKVLAVFLFNIRSELVERWGRHLAYSRPQTIKDTLRSFSTIFQMKKAEGNPKKIPKAEGWSPYIAKDFLVTHGLETGHYHPSFDEWFASSEMKEFGQDIKHNIAYYVEGTKDVAKLLKLKLNVNNSESASEALSKLLAAAEELYFKAFEKKLPDNISQSILKGEEVHVKSGSVEISIEKDTWRNHAYNGFDMKFMISHL